MTIPGLPEGLEIVRIEGRDDDAPLDLGHREYVLAGGEIHCPAVLRQGDLIVRASEGWTIRYDISRNLLVLVSALPMPTKATLSVELVCEADYHRLLVVVERLRAEGLTVTLVNDGEAGFSNRG